MPQEFSRLARLFAAVAGFALLAACGGGGGGGGDGGGGGASITVSGRITFDRLPFQTLPSGGLNAAAPVELPAREVIVEAVSSGSVVASTTTNGNGEYSLSAPANSTVLIRARAQMVKTGTAPTWGFTVRNNTNSDAIYALQGDSFSTGTANVTRNLRALSGWTGNGYTGTRAAAPFAILDTVYNARQLILGAAPTAEFPELNLYWSVDNKNVVGSFCPDTGSIRTSFYFRDPANRETDNCPQPASLPAGIYILGDYLNGAGDTDEFDAHVIAHEFGHYFEDRFSRSDSIAGQHDLADRIDPRLAFGEGWGNAFSAMSLNDPLYRDSRGGISSDFRFNLESDSTTTQGWFAESSVGEFLWDVFDTNAPAESGDNVALGFTPIYAVMIDEQLKTDAATSIFSFASGLRSKNASAAGAINDLLNGEDIHGTDAFGANESNDGDVSGIAVLPVHQPIGLNADVYVCTSSEAGIRDLNKLGNRRLLVFDNTAPRNVVIRANGETNNPSQDAAGDPDIFVYRRGVPVISGELTGVTETINTSLPTGIFVIEVFDAQLNAVSSRPRCMTVSITG